MSGQKLIPVAVPAPLYRVFDYEAGEGMTIVAGARLRVPLGKRQVVGVALGPPRAAESSPPLEGRTYKGVSEVLDAEALVPEDVLELCRWAAAYWQHPLGEVLSAALPGPLRRGGKALLKAPRAKRAQAGNSGEKPRRRKKGEAAPQVAPVQQAPSLQEPLPALTPEQAAALAVLQDGAGFSVTLLEGVTGSGKTELYLRCAARALDEGRQVLVLVPEIGLTPQLTDRFVRRFGAGVASYHSGMADGARAQAWLRTRAGLDRIVIGTRSAAFLPMPQLGLVIVDEEHDGSFKQQDGLRYSARDLAILRGQRAAAPVILGSATPSLETLHNARAGRYRHARLTRRVHAVAPPRITVLDVRGRPLEHGLLPELLQAVERTVDAGGQALLFINRRGYAPALLCHDCGWQAPCKRCDARMTLHRSRGRLICHHCANEQAVPVKCADCGSTGLVPLGQGTERIEDALRIALPGRRVQRFDSDHIRKRGELERLLDEVRAGKIDVLVGTQMLAKGHDFPGLSLVGILDVDAGLYGSDFRATEKMGAMITQVSGRAGRAGQSAEVYLQTHQPQHPLLRRLLADGYDGLCETLVAQRREAKLPPFSHLALLRAESGAMASALEFLGQARAALGRPAGIEILGPVPAPMEKLGGRYRAQLLLQSGSRPALQKLLAGAVPGFDALPGARKLRWSIDVDPIDLF